MSTYVQDLTKQVVQQPVQYIHSANFDQPKPDDTDGKVSTYFFPSMVFPTYTELISATLMYNNDGVSSTDRKIKLAIAENGGSDKPIERKEYEITHKRGELFTTIKFNPPFVLDPHQSFYFHTDKEKEALQGSCIVLGYRNYNANFGGRMQTPLKKN